MSTFTIKKGRSIPLKGAAAKELVDKTSVKRCAIQPPDFRGLKPRLQVQEGDTVKVGSVLIVGQRSRRVKTSFPISWKSCCD